MPVPEVDAMVFDVLGTLVDEHAGLRSAIATAVAGRGDAEVGALLQVWLDHVEREQGRILDGRRPYAPSDEIDGEAAALVAQRAGITDTAVVSTLGDATHRLPPWPDAQAGLARLAEHLPVVGLSNASWSALARLNAHAGLRWHLALSTQNAAAYKPAPAAYRLAVDVTARPPERLLMVAAHEWDLRGARSAGLRTAYIARSGEAPADDGFDLTAEGLADLADQLGLP